MSQRRIETPPRLSPRLKHVSTRSRRRRGADASTRSNRQPVSDPRRKMFLVACLAVTIRDGRSPRGSATGARAHHRQCPRQESNLHPALRRRVLYPLSYEGGSRLRVSGRRAGVAQRSSYLGNSIVARGLGRSDMSTRVVVFHALGVGWRRTQGCRVQNGIWHEHRHVRIARRRGCRTFQHRTVAGGEITARSPLQLFWRRFRADRVAMVSLGVHRRADPRSDLRAAGGQAGRSQRAEPAEPQLARRVRPAPRSDLRASIWRRRARP